MQRATLSNARDSADVKERSTTMAFASGPGLLPGEIPPGITLSSLQDSFYALLGCVGLLLIALFLLGLVLRKDPGRFWQRKLVIVVAAMSLLALISAIQAWSAYQSFAHFGLPLNAGYYDWYERIGQGGADQFDSAVTSFGTWAILLSIVTLALLYVVGKHLVTSLRAQRTRSAPRLSDSAYCSTKSRL